MKEPNCSISRLSMAALASASLLVGGVVAQGQPQITLGYPNGAYQFQSASAMTFMVSSAESVSNISVQLMGTTLSGSPSLKVYTIGNGITVSGPANSPTASVALSSNLLYSAIIQAVDAKGFSSSTNVSFDTINPIYTFEAEDWDYDNGQYINNPQTNRYANQPSTSGVDYNNANPGGGNASYRPQGMETENCSDTPRAAYVGTTNVDYDVGYSTAGGWANYTRNFPPGVYNVYARLANGSGGSGISSEVTIVSSADSTAQLIGDTYAAFSDVPTAGWQVFKFFPLVDYNNALVLFTNDGTATTLQITTINSGPYNANFYMLMPVNTNMPSPGPTITNMYPTGNLLFEPTNYFSFTVTSTNGLSAGNILVSLTGTTIVGQQSLVLYSVANGLTANGNANSLNVSVPLAYNLSYTAFIQAIDNNGNASGQSLSFSTVNPVSTWEAVDYDYNFGQYINNPQTNEYANVSGEFGFDLYVDNPAGGGYRSDSYPGGAHFESGNDVPRAPWYNTGLTRYDIGNNDAPNWFNYTRDYNAGANYQPAGTYNIYVRYANGGGGPGSMSLARVTSGLGLTNTSQVVTNLGTFTLPSTPGWETYAYAPLKDANGNLVNVTLSGTETVRAYNLNSLNFEFFMLMPENTTIPVVTGLYPDGNYFFEGTNKLAFTVSSSQGIATNAIVLTINGTTATGLTFSGSSTSWQVTWPYLQANSNYTASLSATSLGGNNYSESISFDTYAATDYQWESADYDYTSNGVPGLYFENGQVDDYAGLTATPGIDEAENTSGAPLGEDVYRYDPNQVLLICTQGGGDKARVQFGNNPTWRINWFGYGDFANYTRHYPKGKYHVMTRYTEGGGASAATLWKVTAGHGTANQTTSLLGTFPMALGGWNLWDWTTLVDSNSVPVTVSFDGTLTTLQLQGPVTNDGQTSNVGFFLLVPIIGPAPTLTPVLSGGNLQLSFATSTGASYQVQYTSSLTSPVSWTNLGSAIPGNNATQSVSDSVGAGPRFYRVMAQ